MSEWGQKFKSLFFNAFTWAGAIWVGGWILLWIDGEHWSNQQSTFIFAPAIVALSLGSTAVIVFASVYLRETKDSMRTAIAGTFVLIFLLLVIDLLTISGFRDSLSNERDIQITANGTTTTATITCSPATPTPSTTATNFPRAPKKSSSIAPATIGACTNTAASLVEGLFGVFKWVITAIIIFYFGAGAVAKVSEDKTRRARINKGLSEDGPAPIA